MVIVENWRTPSAPKHKRTCMRESCGNDVEAVN